MTAVFLLWNNMKQKSNKLTGAQGFEHFYTQIYGERWNAIKEAFKKENQAVEYKIPGSQKSYYLDAASVFAALCLPVKQAENILDLCAAPGGKTLVIASRMNEDAKLSSNERSPERKHRLQTVVNECLPEEINRRITVSCSDGATWCTRQTECFDCILLDAPCSSERHVMLDDKYLNTWSPSRIKTVSMEQWALLSSAYRLLQPGGYLLYSTCAICPQENDDMLGKLIKKFNREGDAFTFIEPSPDLSEIEAFVKMELPEYEKTKYGYEIFPDVQNGAGPIFFSLIKKGKSIN